MNLFEIMQGAAGGNGLDRFSSQFGLPGHEVARVMQAFLPAFSTGLKRNTADPLSLLNFMQRLGTGDFSSYYRNPAQGSGQDVQNLLGLLFGSAQVSRAVIEQASAFTGIGRSTLERMLPEMAATLLGGLQQQMPVSNPWFAALLAQFGGEEAPGRPAARRSSDAKGPLDRYEDEQAASAERAAAGNPLTHLQAEGMRSTLAALEAGGSAWSETLRKFAGGDVAGLAAPGGETRPRDLFGDMFEPGLALSEAYQRNIAGIFDRLGKATPAS